MGHIERHRRRSIRLKGYDYTRDGAYFVTLCTQERVCVFGTVADGEMQLNECGRGVVDSWLWLAERYPYVHLDEWAVMPNHMHGIIVIVDDRRGGRGGSRTAPTGPVGQTAAPIKRKPLGRLIGAFKTVSTRRVNDIRSTPSTKLWQRNYYEHVVRDDLSLRRMRGYIAGNPSRWELDRENSARLLARSSRSAIRLREEREV